MTLHAIIFTLPRDDFEFLFWCTRSGGVNTYLSCVPQITTKCQYWNTVSGYCLNEHSDFFPFMKNILTCLNNSVLAFQVQSKMTNLVSVTIQTIKTTMAVIGLVVLEFCEISSHHIILQKCIDWL